MATTLAERWMRIRLPQNTGVHSENSDPICQNPNMTPNLGYGDKWVITLSEKSIRIKGSQNRLSLGNSMTQDNSEKAKVIQYEAHICAS